MLEIARFHGIVVKLFFETHRHYLLPRVMPAMIRRARGHYNYFRVVGNMTSLWIFHREVVKLLYKWLNRRSQRRSLSWDGIKRVLMAYAFPAPTQPMGGMNSGARVKACTSARVSMTEEPGAGKPRAGVIG